MRKTFLLLVTSTMLTAVIGLSAVSAMQAPAVSSHSFATPVTTAAQVPVVLVSGDDDDDRGNFESSRGGHDDDRGNPKSSRRGDDDDNDCEDGCGGAGNPAPAGTVAPPQNGLFGNGAPPQVQVN